MYLLLFHVCTTSGSVIPCCIAWSSRKSNIYLIANGRALPRWAVLNIVSNKSSTNFWSVNWNHRNSTSVGLPRRTCSQQDLDIDFKNAYLCGQESCEVNLGYHFVTPLTLFLVVIVMVFHQVPHLSRSVEVILLQKLKRKTNSKPAPTFNRKYWW